ncbi:MAG: 4Fe-4S dicluster domain-containing protein [Nitrososphaerota archaeon]|jgi:ferredoxin|nr:4Fe-4S dicluster domain-containing protein [Nitrososphaerota archaeon]
MSSVQNNHPVRIAIPFKALKKDTLNSLTLEWFLQVKNYRLTLDRNRCVGCQICLNACPKRAITFQKQLRLPGEVAKKVKIDIDGDKCNFCGICDVTCLYGAIKVVQNGNANNDLSVLVKKSYPAFIRNIVVDTRKCDKKCVECEAVCPLKLIKISKITYDGKPIQDLSVLSPLGQKRVQIRIDIQNGFCPTCRLCEFKCAGGSIKVKKIFDGHFLLDSEKCLKGCRDCVDICPIVGTLSVDVWGRVVVDEQTCTFCGACQNVCPNPEALSIRRINVQHTPIRSGAWNKALERITSPEGAVREFKAHATQIRQKIVKKRFEIEAMKKK